MKKTGLSMGGMPSLGGPPGKDLGVGHRVEIEVRLPTVGEPVRDRIGKEHRTSINGDVPSVGLRGLRPRRAVAVGPGAWPPDSSVSYCPPPEHTATSAAATKAQTSQMRTPASSDESVLRTRCASSGPQPAHRAIN